MAEHYQVVVHVDHSALIEGPGRAGLPIESVRRIACDSDRVVLVEDERGEPLSIGRKSRVVPAAIRRVQWARDRGCRFPGCGRKRFVDAHHVEHWSAGGQTSLDNLMLLCHSHHKLCHEGGFTIGKDYRDRWFFRRPDGVAVPPSGYGKVDMTDDDVWTEGEYLDGHPSAEGFSAGLIHPPRRDLRLKMIGRSGKIPSGTVGYDLRQPVRDAVCYTFRMWYNIELRRRVEFSRE